VLGLPVAVLAVAVGLNILLGATVPMWERVPPLLELPMVFLVIALMIGLGEEPAWRGFAQQPDWRAAQEAQAQLSRNSQLIVVPHSSHFVSLDQPQAIADAVLQVVEAVRTGQLLQP
jgi:hypothetical protein